MPELEPLIAHYGYAAVGVVVALENLGLPLPGETILILSAVYAATHPDLPISGVIGAAALGAILGGSAGYWLGREFGYPLLLRYGRYVGLSERRIKLGQYLFLRHGGKVVFFGRFFALLRVLAAFLAGVNRMEWKSFLFANAAGSVLWSLGYGLAAYSFGAALFHSHGRVTIALVIIGVVIVAVGLRYLRAHEAELERQAELALPGPLQPVDCSRRRRRD
jgi:membrane protein DedA with SNARE-associated domain